MVTRKQFWVFTLDKRSNTFAVGVAESEIDKTDSSIIIDEQVLGFEVAMDDIKFVDVLNSCDYLLEYGTGFVLGNSE